MAYWIYATGYRDNANCKSFICDYVSDIGKLPTQYKNGIKQDGDNVAHLKTAAGSDCFCLEDSSTWILGKAADTWVMSKKASSGGGSESGQNDYTQLINKPSIEGTELNGDLSFNDLGIQETEISVDTNDKTIPGAINELADKIDTISEGIASDNDVVEF